MACSAAAFAAASPLRLSLPKGWGGVGWVSGLRCGAARAASLPGSLVAADTPWERPEMILLELVLAVAPPYRIRGGISGAVGLPLRW